MRSNPVSFRLGNLAFTHANLPIGEDRLGNRVYNPWIQGFIYTPFTRCGFSSPPTPMLYPVREQAALPGLSQGLPAPCQGSSGRLGSGRGIRRAARNTHRFFQRKGLEFMSSGLLVFRAAQAAVVPSVPLKTVRRNFKRGCRRFA
jgi:hypothetical protein